MLYVKRSRIRGTWPLMAGGEGEEEDIRKFEEIGTHPVAYPLAVSDALTFHERLGPSRKWARLKLLRDTWAKRVQRIDRVRLNTSLADGMANSLANFTVEGIEPGDIYSTLMKRHRIITCPIGHADCTGIRVSPSVYSTMEEIDRFCEAVEDVIRNGVVK